MTIGGSDRGARKTGLTAGVVQWFVQIAFLVALQAILLFVSVGRPDWSEGWLYIGLYLFFIALNAVLILPKGTGLIEERARMSVKGMGPAGDGPLLHLWIGDPGCGGSG